MNVEKIEVPTTIYCFFKGLYASVKGINFMHTHPTSCLPTETC